MTVSAIDTNPTNPGSRRSLRVHRRAMSRRKATVIAAAVTTVLLSAGYIVADMADVVPGLLTTSSVQPVTFPAAKTARTVKTVTAQVQNGPSLDASQAQKLVDEFAASEGVGTDFSLIIADAQGNAVVKSNETATREPASTMKTLTAFAAASTLDMTSTLDTEVYLTGSGDSAKLTLKGNGDMLLGSGESDPDHINGRAGIATLVSRTVAALRNKNITTVDLAYDDSLFGSKRLPDTIAANNTDLMNAAPMASMAIDQARNWTGADKPSDPDVDTKFPPRSSTPAADTAAEFARQLAAQGITVTGTTEGTAPKDGNPIASVSSAKLSEIMSYMLRNSNNTEAELFGRLTALKTGQENSPEGATKAVKSILESHGINTTGLTMADCSGLSTGSQLTVETLLQTQAKYAQTGTAVAAASEALAVSGLSGTALHHTFPSSSNGLIRLKTGTLDTVTSMTGNVSRTKGGVITFAIIINNPQNMWSAIQALDHLVGQLPEL
ncbi:D-alanyl-D-alanine carboxypeptidase/D-alanyl-D-alanine endopeptidase [Bifidobacterium callimiconis]|uniref:D-alanyl-D-alanine carboxypeptidase n=1 Tax=Bifidobacterium callimiconis TaxID=2306973 RepID=A0A430F7U1_9BIFI|nr:D-alanyl-D-alanine carboxypeptidase/D-alanyl-D-alanine-endopeptidase [Bifidobacterium callimiconis]RSX48983.1 D-alanyl-D-alanine carboxypeptidase [Bifidobacterium callimiconis]